MTTRNTTKYEKLIIIVFFLLFVFCLSIACSAVEEIYGEFMSIIFFVIMTLSYYVTVKIGEMNNFQ